MTAVYDVLIIGGGLVGASLACALEPVVRQYQLKVALVETHDLEQPRVRPPSFDARSSALSHGTRLIYQRLGIWPALAPQATAIRQVHVSDRGHFGMTRLDHQAEGVPALGYVIDNDRLGAVLLERLQSCGRCGQLQLFSPGEVTAIEPEPASHHQRVHLSLAGGPQTVTAALVVLADGGRSGLMARLNIARTVQTYDQQALVANIRTDRNHQGIAYERFAGQGALALLPKKVAGDACHFGLVWTLADRQMDEIASLADSAFLERLQQAFGFRAGRFLDTGRRDSYPLQMSLAQEQVRPGLVILGNAAHAIHPVAGQGYNLAIRDVMALVENIRESLATGQPVGRLGRLLSYVQAQQRDQGSTVAFCNGLVRLFSRHEVPWVLARNLGLVGLDLGIGLKRRFTRAAMGMSMDG